MSDASAHDHRISFNSTYGPGLSEEGRCRVWLSNVILRENKQLGLVAIVFVSDETLHQMNLQHLQHDTLTDILTFPYSYAPIEAEIYISTDRVAEHATLHEVSYDTELRRVMVHGILHMCGYKDKSGEQQQEMRAREDLYLKDW